MSKAAAKIPQGFELDRVIETGLVYRDLIVRAENVDVENREVEFSFSSEEPVRQYFWETGEYGLEILEHSDAAADFARLNTKAPLLKAHSRGNWIGKVLRAWIDHETKRGRVRVKFHKSEIGEFEDFADGTKDSVSFGYAVHRMILESVDEENGPTFRAVLWEPFEISLEPIPADLTVGADRKARAKSDDETRVRTEVLIRSAATPADQEPESRKESEMKTDDTIPAPTPDFSAERAEAQKTAREAELARMQGIEELSRKYDDKVPAVAKVAREAIASGMTVGQFEGIIAPILDATPAERFAGDPKENDVGLTRRETESFSLRRLFAALAFGRDEPSFREEAAFELKACEAARKNSNAPRGAVVVPSEVLRASVPGGSALRGAVIAEILSGMNSRDMTAGGATTGADFVQTDVLGGSLIDFLRDMSVLIPRSTLLRGLQGNVAIPRVTAGVAGVWVAEGTAPSESTPTLDQMTLSPRTVTAHVDVTRRLLLQSSVDVEAWLRREFGSAFAVTLENGAITDDGGVTTRPEGVLGLAGTVQNNVGGGSFDWAHVVKYETNVATGAALVGDLAYLTNPKVAGLMKTTSKDTGSGRFIMENGEANGYDVAVTNQVPSDLGAGTDSAMIFGNLKDVHFGLWEELAFTVDPYTQANAGVIRLTGQMEADVNFRHPESFSVAEDIAA